MHYPVQYNAEDNVLLNQILASRRLNHVIVASLDIDREITAYYNLSSPTHFSQHIGAELLSYGREGHGVNTSKCREKVST